MTEYKTVSLEEIKVLDDSQGIVEAFTNSMGSVDSDGDIILPDAFNASIEQNMPVTVLMGHDSSKIIGKVIEAKAIRTESEQARLYNRIKFNLDTQMGREAFSNIAGGYAKEWSVGFNIPSGDSEFSTQGGNPVRLIKNVDWVEVSSVIRGASPNTETISAKEDVPNETAITDGQPVYAADDEVPLVTEAFVPSTDEQRDQILTKLDEMRARQVGFRLKKSRRD